MSALPRKYTDSLEQERRIYHDCVEVHSLPEIFHYWSNTHLLPSLAPFGLRGANDLFLRTLRDQFKPGSVTPPRFVSVGSGNCDLEVLLAQQLTGEGLNEFTFDCVDLNPAMLERGRVAARTAGLEDRFAVVEADLNSWLPRHEYHAAIANQSLHHVLNLENLYEQMERSLVHGGCFAISDMIGRNGHLRWPEALHIVHEFWREMPPSYRLNRSSGCYEEMFLDHDCSGDGFEGVRSQDILPLLLDRFQFRFFFPFGNLIDPFVDRSFGPNFNLARAWDKAFIDRVQARDMAELASGHLKPTHMLAVVSKEAPAAPVFPGRLSPEFCVRSPRVSPKLSMTFPMTAYCWENWRDTAHEELRSACAMLAASTDLIRQRTQWAQDLERESAARLEWGYDTERQLDEVSRWAHTLEEEANARTEWAQALHLQLKERTVWARSLEAQLDERTQWALRLNAELEEKTRWAEILACRLEAETERALRLEREPVAYARLQIRRFFASAVCLVKRLTGAK